MHITFQLNGTYYKQTFLILLPTVENRKKKIVFTAHKISSLIDHGVCSMNLDASPLSVVDNNLYK